MKTKDKLCLLFNISLKRKIITAVELIIPIFIAIPQVWGKFILPILPNWLVTIIYQNSVSIKSAIGIIAGAYLTIFSTRYLKRQDDIKSSVFTKKEKIYLPLFDNLECLIKVMNQHKYVRFSEIAESTEYKYNLNNFNYIRFGYWNYIKESDYRFLIPKGFEKSFNSIIQLITTFKQDERNCWKVIQETFEKNYPNMNNDIMPNYRVIFEEFCNDEITPDSISVECRSLAELNSSDYENLAILICANLKDSTAVKNYYESRFKILEKAQGTWVMLHTILEYINKKYGHAKEWI